VTWEIYHHVSFPSLFLFSLLQWLSSYSIALCFVYPGQLILPSVVPALHSSIQAALILIIYIRDALQYLSGDDPRALIYIEPHHGSAILPLEPTAAATDEESNLQCRAG
jgi:hypothetical protein